MKTLERGFKSWAERVSTGLRQDLGLKSVDPLSPFRLSEYLNIRLTTPLQLNGLSKECLNQLLKIDKNGWSALTLNVGDEYCIIYNSTHSKARQNSDVMHEIAHIVKGHEPSCLILSPDGSLVMRTFDQKQEDEAAWLSGCLLLPREALAYVKKRRLSIDKVCHEYNVSESLARFRINVSGISRQYRY